MNPVLSVLGMSTGYAGQPVVHDLTFDVAAGEVVCLLGSNGAGKSTTMLALSGELPLLAGDVRFDGVRSNAALFRRARAGMSYVPEERSVIKGLSLSDNLKVAGVDLEAALALFPELGKRTSVSGGMLSGGEQQMLALARGLARAPRLLLADELSLGLAPLIVDRLLDAVRRAADERGTAVLIVEQHAHKALRYADRTIVMRRGRMVLELPADEARRRFDEVQKAYLTGGADAAVQAGEGAAIPIDARGASEAGR
jgi:branched-chain amino acid transport system ATP-binding protein